MKTLKFVKIFFVSLFLLSGCIHVSAQPVKQKIWSAKKANNWYAKQGWMVGANFLPSTAINQLEMWQEESFDTTTISRELGWAAGIGMNVMRVYLHDLAWKADAPGIKKRMNQYLSIADRHKIKTVFTIFDDCWNAEASIGKQPDPKPGIHNSGWVRSPTKSVHDDSTQWGYLEVYVKDILSTFSKDQRVVLWDLYNEPGNSGYNLSSLPLLKKVFEWAWTVRPSQPLSVGVWYDNQTLSDFSLTHSDVITFHNYVDINKLEAEIIDRKKLGRPLICTEYMARSRNSNFITHLPVFKKYNVAAINWGLVAGKSNTIYQWDTPIKDGSEPALWFHDVFRKDGSPYKKEEVEIIKQLTKGK